MDGDSFIFVSALMVNESVEWMHVVSARRAQKDRCIVAMVDVLRI